MTESVQYQSDWWRWWSDPLINMHPSHQGMLPYSETHFKALNFLLFLELRSLLGLPDQPDSSLAEQAEWRSLALATPQEMSELSTRTAVLCLDSSILQANAHTWRQMYGVQSPAEVRQLIQVWGQIPSLLKPWQESLFTQLNRGEHQLFDLDARAQIVLGAYLSGFYPHLFKRYALTLPHAITQVIQAIELLSSDYQTTIESWLMPAVRAMHNAVQERYPVHIVEQFDAEDTDEQPIESLINLEEWNDA